MLIGAARGLALFLGAFTLLNLLGAARFDPNLWWIDLWPLPATVARVVLAVAAVAMLAYAVRPGGLRARPTWRRAATSALMFVLFIGSAIASIRYYYALARGEIRSVFPLPLSLPIAMAMLLLAAAPYHDARERRWAFPTAFAAALILFPLAQITLYGVTDYRRPADLIVVFGANPQAAADRVRTACELYRAGYAKQILFSGGPGEPGEMQRVAASLGVPLEAVLLDPHGVNTEASVRNTVAVTRGRILAVSHFYHLPRIKMTFQRYGVDVYTVPSVDTVKSTMPWNIAREELAFWAYYLRHFVK
jgi:uncharacterized SAM-binding protein YcdF (DUF218 family)